MKTTTELTDANQRTLDRIFQRPITHNLEWRDIHAFLGDVTDVARIQRQPRLMVATAVKVESRHGTGFEGRAKVKRQEARCKNTAILKKSLWNKAGGSKCLMA
jgi:hypothetical protein